MARHLEPEVLHGRLPPPPLANLSSSGGARGALHGGVLRLVLLERTTITAITVNDTVWDQMVLHSEVLKPLGPALEDIVAHMELREVSNLFEARVCIQYKYADGPWSTIAAGDIVLAGQTTADYHISAPFNDRSRLGRLHIRLVLQYHAKAGGAAGARADCSVTVACGPRCC